MPDLRAQLEGRLAGDIAWVGLGNVDLGDDAFGVRLAEALERRGCPHVAAPGLEPERWLIRPTTQAFDHVVFLDAVDFGGAPGSAVFLDRDAMRGRFPQVSTHRLSLGLLAEWVEMRSGDRRSEVGGRRSEVGGRRSEVGDRRSEVGGRRLAIGDWRSQRGHWTSNGGFGGTSRVRRDSGPPGHARAWLLGAQPESMRPGAPLTETLRVTLEALADLIAEFCGTADGKAALTAHS